MRSNPRRRPAAAIVCGLALGAAFLAGCQKPSRVDLVSYRDPYFPEKYSLTLRECAYRIDPTGDYDILGYAERPSADQQQPPIRQWLHVRLFWRPRPGKTNDNPSGVDALIRYVITTPQGTSTYSGAAFVYPEKRRFGNDVRAAIESAQLKPAGQRGDSPELLGTVRLAGKLSARSDASRAIDLLRELDQQAGVAGR